MEYEYYYRYIHKYILHQIVKCGTTTNRSGEKLQGRAFIGRGGPSLEMIRTNSYGSGWIESLGERCTSRQKAPILPPPRPQSRLVPSNPLLPDHLLNYKTTSPAWSWPDS